MENNIDYSSLGVDPELQPLLHLEGVTPAACRSYTLWMHAYTAHQIASIIEISVEHAEADITLIKRLLPADKLAQHIEERNDIIESEIQFKDRQRKFHESLTRPLDEYLAEGKDPIAALREFREYANAKSPDETQDRFAGDGNIRSDGKEGEITENPSQIRDLRRRSNQSGIDEGASMAPEEENQIIAALRRADQKPSTKATTQSHIAPERESSPILQNAATKSHVGQKPGADRADRRVTVRLDPDLFGKVNSRCNDLGIDLSTAIRRAITQFLAGDAPSQNHANMTMPAEALALIGPFQVWGSDLREELRLRFLTLLAMSYVTKGRWPRTEWAKELHFALLPLYQCLEKEDVRQK
jgi:hypothetical protein